MAVAKVSLLQKFLLKHRGQFTATEQTVEVWAMDGRGNPVRPYIKLWLAGDSIEMFPEDAEEIAKMLMHGAALNRTATGRNKLAPGTPDPRD